MKWPFVRRSKYEDVCSMYSEHMEDSKNQFYEINRLNQELANEKNNHRETRRSLLTLIRDIKSYLDNIEKSL